MRGITFAAVIAGSDYVVRMLVGVSSASVTFSMMDSYHNVIVNVVGPAGRAVNFTHTLRVTQRGATDRRLRHPAINLVVPSRSCTNLR